MQLKHWKSGHAAECKNQVNADKSTKNLNIGQKAGIQNDLNSRAALKLWPEFEIIDEEEDCDEELTTVGDMAIISSGKEDETSMHFQEVRINNRMVFFLSQ